MSWAEVKKINSNLNMPLDKLISNSNQPKGYVITQTVASGNDPTVIFSLNMPCIVIGLAIKCVYTVHSDYRYKRSQWRFQIDKDGSAFEDLTMKMPSDMQSPNDHRSYEFCLHSMDGFVYDPSNNPSVYDKYVGDTTFTAGISFPSAIGSQFPEEISATPHDYIYYAATPNLIQVRALTYNNLIANSLSVKSFMPQVLSDTELYDATGATINMRVIIVPL